MRRVTLDFDPKLDRLPGGDRIRSGLSGVAAIGDTLWLVHDELLSIERLGRAKGAKERYAGHTQFPLADYLRLPAPPKPRARHFEEADLEDLDFAGGYLWLVSSHALKREAPDADDAPTKAESKLAEIVSDGNRYLLARIPLEARHGEWTLRKKGRAGEDRRRAARLRGNRRGDELTRVLARDDLLAAFLAIPGKENGLDIEGLAVVGPRVLLGLRGPVMNEWATILEIEPRASRREPSELRLARLGRGGPRVRKHLMKLDGLGVRSLARHGDDLLILAGPTNALDGPVKLFRWRGAAREDRERSVRPADFAHVMDLPWGDGDDHPEGMAVLAPRRGRASLLVVYERASKARYIGAHGVTADIFPLPK